ncbi:MAG: hypothetical protein K2X39_03295, partial [Silvanigrellaceae bacterium]|nr:hypothetical protein [Silvanigrellaceae bacterium]
IELHDSLKQRILNYISLNANLNMRLNHVLQELSALLSQLKEIELYSLDSQNEQQLLKLVNESSILIQNAKTIELILQQYISDSLDVKEITENLKVLLTKFMDQSSQENGIANRIFFEKMKSIYTLFLKISLVPIVHKLKQQQTQTSSDRVLTTTEYNFINKIVVSIIHSINNSLIIADQIPEFIRYLDTFNKKGVLTEVNTYMVRTYLLDKGPPVEATTSYGGTSSSSPQFSITF